jgi:hypothetical protein
MLKNPLLMLALVASTTLRAQAPTFTAPHRGQLARSEQHCIEMVLAGAEARFYLLDTLGAVLPTAGVSGVAYLRFADKSTANPPFEPTKDGGFRVVLTNPNAFTVVPSFKTSKGFVSAEMSSGPRMIVQPVPEQHNADDGHGH